MAYQSRVYRILIASPSDVEEEREVAVRVIQEWNDLYSYTRKVTLLPLRWETHTAPEYGTRPQEVVNRAIVDQCDLLVGIFWTRIGSPTGVAESGTLEEIERVGKAEKPVMLYFSRVPIDPEQIDVSQNERLKQFKATTYPKGLVESYRTQLEFRDKFAKQLELKVRDLQKSDSSGEVPLSLQFLSVDKAELLGSTFAQSLEHPKVSTFDHVRKDKRESIKAAAAARIKELSYIPLLLAVRNASSSGIRNLYIELSIRAEKGAIELTDSPEGTLSWNFDSSFTIPHFYGRESAVASRLSSKLARYDADTLQELDGGWKLAVEWDAIQPQRTRIVKPILYAYATESAQLAISATVYGDSFAEPIILTAGARIDVRDKDVELEELLPHWTKLQEEKSEFTIPLKWLKE